MSTQETAALIESVNNMTATVAGKMGEIDTKVDEAVNAVPQAIKDNFTHKEVNIDPINGDDSSLSGPFRTIGAAVKSVPDGGSINVKLPTGPTALTFNFDEAVNIGSRKVMIQGGWSGMENSGSQAAIFKPIISYNSTYNRSQYKGYFTGEPGGRVFFNYTKIELPRIRDGSSIEHYVTGSFVSGGLTVTMHSHSITGPHLYIEAGTTRPMYFMRSSARDGKANLQDFTLSYTAIQTALGEALIELQYSSGTMRFSAFGSSISDVDGAAVTFTDLFDGLSYGDHGYATNLLASADILKQPA